MIHNWIFNFNEYTQKWSAVTRDNYFDLFNGCKDCLKSSNINTLIELINKTNGDDNKIKELLNKKEPLN